MFNKITAAVLFVQDFENCLEFYRDKVGLPVAMQEPDFAAFKMNDQDFAIQGLATSADMIHVDVKAFAARGPGLGRVLLCTRVENVDLCVENDRFAWLCEPDGTCDNGIECQQNVAACAFDATVHSVEGRARSIRHHDAR